MGYDYEILKDCNVIFLVTDHSTSDLIHESRFIARKGQRISYEIYSLEDKALKER